MKNGLMVIIVNGRPGVGKTTFEDMCIDIMGDTFCQKRSSIDGIKEIAKMGGWEGGKLLKDRKFLSDLKDLFTKYNGFPNFDVMRYLRDWEKELEYADILDRPHLFFIDTREPEDIDRFKQSFNKSIVRTLCIRRPGDEKLETSNHADAEVFNYNYDIVIHNDGDLNHLRHQAEVFIDLIFREKDDIILI